MAAAAAPRATSVAGDGNPSGVPLHARWPALVAYIDALPGLPSWADIERAVDTDVAIGVDQSRATPSEVIANWKRRLAERFPVVALFLDQHTHGPALRAYSASAMHALVFVSDPRLQLDQLLDEWYQVGPHDTPYSTQRMQLADVSRLLAQLATKEREMEATGMMDAFDRSAMARFRADLSTRYMQLVQHQSQPQQRPVLPLVGMGPPALPSNRQYLESILAIVRAPGQYPAAVLSRAREMLETLMRSVSMQ